MRDISGHHLMLARLLCNAEGTGQMLASTTLPFAELAEILTHEDASMIIRRKDRLIFSVTPDIIKIIKSIIHIPLDKFDWKVNEILGWVASTLPDHNAISAEEARLLSSIYGPTQPWAKGIKIYANSDR